MESPVYSPRHRSSSASSSSSLMENLLGLLRVRVKRGVNLAVRDVRSSDPYVVIKMGRQDLCFCSFLLLGSFLLTQVSTITVRFYICFLGSVGVGTAMRAELCALVQGLRVTKSTGFCDLEVEGDSASVISWVVDRQSQSWRLSHLACLAASLADGLNTSFKHVLRSKLKTRVMKKNVNPEWNEDLTLSVSDPNLPVKLTVYDKDTFSLDDKMGDAEFGIKPYLEALKMHLEGLPSGTIITRIQPCRQNCLAEESCVTWSEGKIVQDICLRLRNVECGEVELQLQWIDLPGSKGL